MVCVHVECRITECEHNAFGHCCKYYGNGIQIGSDYKCETYEKKKEEEADGGAE